MQWNKQGVVFKPDNHFNWMCTHAQVPVVHVLKDRFKVFFATRDAQSLSRIGCIDLDINDPKKVLHVYEKPILDLGKLGAFDEDGVVPSCLISKGDEIWLYYNGWNKKVSTPYHNAIGIAVSKDNGKTFTRMFDGPVIDRTTTEPYMHVSPSVVKDEKSYKAWYVSGTKWITINGKHEPVYVLRFATSEDGIVWNRKGGPSCIPQKDDKEAIAKACVRYNNGIYSMWYCYRGSEDFRDGVDSYRIGYAESKDGESWERKDEQSGISLSDSDWDSTMQCYPYIVENNGKLYMFYNGNGFGRSGIGFATMDMK